MNSFWDFLWLLLWTYVLIAYLVLLFHIIGDVFRDRDLGGFAKALWLIGLIFCSVPRRADLSDRAGQGDG